MSASCNRTARVPFTDPPQELRCSMLAHPYGTPHTDHSTDPPTHWGAFTLTVPAHGPYGQTRAERLWRLNRYAVQGEFYDPVQIRDDIRQTAPPAPILTEGEQARRLPVGSVVRDTRGRVYQLMRDGGPPSWYTPGEFQSDDDMAYPLEVLYYSREIN